ncbi:MAG: hypothetical protein KAS90_02115 [Candidatus Aenigmarchaeota archaeon]|nr:hypothetical protein [Candidatus Aenigmarchaeota archaeon]
MKKIEENGETPVSATYAEYGIADVSELAYVISKSHMGRLQALLRITPGNPGFLKSIALDMAYAKDPETAIYSIWDRKLHEGLDLLPRFDSCKATSIPELYGDGLKKMAEEIMSLSSYTGTIKPEILDSVAQDILSPASLSDLWFALHDEIYNQAEKLIDSVAAMGPDMEYARSQLYVRRMLEKDEDTLARRLVEYYIEDLDLMTSGYLCRKREICEIADEFDKSYGSHYDAFNDLSGLLQEYNAALRVMECAVFAKWITDERKIPLDKSVCNAFMEKEILLDSSEKKIGSSMNSLKQKLPITSGIVVDGDTYTDDEINKMFRQFEKAYDLLEDMKTDLAYLRGDMDTCCCRICEP